MTLREALQAVYDRHGKLTPELVVSEAREQATEAGKTLHGRLEWNDKKAGESWRREQALDLIRSVRVVYKEDDQKTVRGWHSVPSEKGYVFEPLEVIKTDKFTRNLVLQQMEREWKALFQRYQDFEEFVQMVEEDLGRNGEGG